MVKWLHNSLLRANAREEGDGQKYLQPKSLTPTIKKKNILEAKVGGEISRETAS